MTTADAIDPIEFSFREIHTSLGTKHFVDFDFDKVDFSTIEDKIPCEYHVLHTKGGFHLICPCTSVGIHYNSIRQLGCDVHGSAGMIPIPGCFQRGFVPFLESKKGRPGVAIDFLATDKIISNMEMHTLFRRYYGNESTSNGSQKSN